MLSGLAIGGRPSTVNRRIRQRLTALRKTVDGRRETAVPKAQLKLILPAWIGYNCLSLGQFGRDFCLKPVNSGRIAVH